MLGTNSGSIEVPAFQRIVRLARLTAFGSAVWTFLCAALLAGLQIWSGSADTYRVSSVVRLSSPARVYVTASLSETEWTLKKPLVNWLLDLPAIGLLLIVATLLAVFYLWLAVIEKREFGDQAGR
jgi:hypothetical protein